MKKIVFVINSIKQARCVRRVEEFIERGYQVNAYGFDREGDHRALPNIPLTVVGTFQNGSNYFNRLRDIRSAIKNNIENKYNPEDTIFYLFNLDVVLAFRSAFSKKYKYIYEVSDLAELVVGNPLIRKFLIWQNYKSMKNAFHVVFTSEGFCDFYNRIPQEKISVIPNRISTNCPKVEKISRSLNPEHIKIGFVGIIRFETVLNFAKVCSRNKNIDFHLYGMISNGDEYALELEQLANNTSNITLHGPFKSPTDLPSIYEGIDMVLSAYPPTPGVIYAEPNKLYEAIYFRCPIIVNKGTFLGRKVERLNVGYVIDAMSESNIQSFLDGISADAYLDKVKACQAIPQVECLNINDVFFEKLKSLC